MDIESITRDIVGMKEVKVEAVGEEKEMTRIVSCLRDIPILKVHHSTCGLPDNTTKLIIRVSLDKTASLDSWVHHALRLAFEKSTLTFNQVAS